MRDCLILGSGRSGTSLAAGVLSRAGYFMGRSLNPANITNPKGQFEDREVNAVNEELLAQVTPARPENFLGNIFFRSRPKTGQRWLARLPLNISFQVSGKLEPRIRALLANRPYCFKDPRFSYTLPAWRPYLQNTVLVCVFRHPGVTVSSIIKQNQTVAHLADFSIGAGKALEVWNLMYSHILDKHLSKGGEWIFLHYHQFFDGSATHKLEKILEAEVDKDFADKSLSRSQPTETVSRRSISIYERLCELSGYKDQKA
jgi:hypothetical protein